MFVLWLSVAAFCLWLGFVGSTFYYPLGDFGSFWSLSKWFALVLFVPILFWIRRPLSAERKIVSYVILAVVLFVVWGLCAASMSLLNGLLDRSQATTHACNFVSTYQKSYGRGISRTRNHWLEITGCAPELPSGGTRLQVGGACFEALKSAKPSQKIYLDTHPGKFGVLWLERCRPNADVLPTPKLTN